MSENIKFWVEDNIMHVEFLAETISYQDVDEAVKKRLEFSKGNEYLMFGDLRKTKKITREARERFSGKDAGKGIKAVAILINSKTQAVIYNFFSKIYKPPAPAKIFYDKKKALMWLRKFE